MCFPSAHRRVRSKSPLSENKFPACLLKTGGELLLVVGVPMGKGGAAATDDNSLFFALHIRSALGTSISSEWRLASDKSLPHSHRVRREMTTFAPHLIYIQRKTPHLLDFPVG